METRLLLQDLAANLFNLETVALRTVLGLLRNPGRVCRDYVQGKRIRYVSPWRYFLSILTLTLLLNFLAGFDPTKMQPRPDFTPKQAAVQQLIGSFVVQKLDLILLAVLPIFIAAVRRLFGRRRANYAETSVFVLFVMAQVLLLGLPMIPLRSLSPGLVVVAKILLQVSLLTWAAKEFFGLSTLSSSLRSVAATAVYFLLVISMVTLFSLPRVLELMRTYG